MDIRCVNCGATLAGPPPGGLPFHCSYCGAPQPTGAAPPASPYAQGPSPFGAPPPAYGAPPPAYGAPPPGMGAPQNPYGPGPSPYGASPPAVMQLQGPGAVGARANPVALVVAVAVFITFAGAMVAFISMHAHPTTGGGITSSGGFATKSLATLSLAQTPDAMAKVTGVPATTSAMGDTEMDVKLSGGPYNRMNITWDKTDLSHAKELYLYADTPAPSFPAVHAKLATLLGPRLDAKGDLNWQQGFFSYNLDTARAMAMLDVGGMDKNPHWKQQVDAAWDVLRGVVLGLPVTVTDADTRDWLGKGYTLASVGAIDPAIDVDHAAAAMTAAFPGATSRSIGNLEFVVAIDNPWFSQVEMDWPNQKGGSMERVILRPPPVQPWVFPDQAAIEACVQAALGAKGKEQEEDHLKGTHRTEWQAAEGGNVSVSNGMVFVEPSSHWEKKKMGHADFQKLLTALGACAPKK